MRRIIALDIYKALAAVMVIIIHVTAYPIVTLTRGIAENVLIVVNKFSNPSVPMFVFASGLSLFYIYGNRGIVFDHFLKKRLPKILIPYLSWCVIYYAIYVYKGIYVFSAQTFLFNVLTGRMMYHLYFVVIIIQFYLVFGLINFVVKRYSEKVILPLSLAINILATKVLPVSYLDRSFLTYLIYFVLGCYVAKNLEKATELLYRHKILLAFGFLSLGGIYAYQFYEAQFLNISARFIPGAYGYISFCTVAILFYYLVAMVIEKKSEPQIAIGIEKKNEPINKPINKPINAGEPTNKAIMADVPKSTKIDAGVIRKGLLALSDGSYYIYLSHPFAIIAAGSISARLGITGVIDQMMMAFIVVGLTSVPLSILYANLKSKRGA